jgi:hypothetical protein
MGEADADCVGVGGCWFYMGGGCWFLREVDAGSVGVGGCWFYGEADAGGVRLGGCWFYGGDECW